jgi:hypothetical protein
MNPASVALADQPSTEGAGRQWHPHGQCLYEPIGPSSQVARMKRSGIRERKNNSSWISLRSIQATNFTDCTNQEETTMKRQLLMLVLLTL